MRTKLRSKIALLFMTCAVLLAIPVIALADDISNSLDTSIDAVAETMPLTVGGANGTTTLYVQPTGGDGKPGCNLTSSSTLGLSVTSSNTSVATVSPSSVTFTSCGDTKALTVTPQSAGSATISVAQTSNSTGGSFNLAPATFTVNVSPPPNTAPTVTVGGVTGGASYNKGSVPAATCNVVDAEDGNSSFPANLSSITGPYASDGIGSQTASCSYTDGGGLTASASETYSIVDPSGPVITKLVTPASPDGSNGWYKGNVTVDWTVSDPESPNSLQKTGCVDQNITTDQAATTYSCSATSAGGSAGPETVTIKRDGTAPSNPTASFDRSPEDSTGGYFKDTVTVSYGGSTDALSGVASYTADETFSASGPHNYSGKATDNAGNDSLATSGTVKVDADNPTVQLTCPTAPVIKGSSASANWTASDGESGLATASSGSVSLNTSTVGTQTASVPAGTAQDKVGHDSVEDSCTYSVVFNFAGFRAPVDNGGIFNAVKAGQSVPMKFSLSGNQGLGIIALGYPKATAVACPTSSTFVDQIEETTTANNGLTYDATADQYNYVWKTPSTYAGKCYQFNMVLTDGTSHTALFKFTK